MAERFEVLNNKTGELENMYKLDEGDRVVSKTQLDAQYKYMNKGKGSGFVFALYKKCNKYLESDLIKQADIARIIMLATYVSWDGYLKKTERTNLTKKDMQEILRMKSRNSFGVFYSTMIDIGIIYEEPDGLRLNNTLFIRGELGKVSKEIGFTRLFISEIRGLYNNVKITDIKKLGHVFALIPHISFEHNVACFNPNEMNRSKILPMRLGDFAEVIGMDRKYSKKLFSSMASIRLPNGEGILGLFMTKLDYKIATLIINPKMLYRGDIESNEKKAIHKLFSDELNDNHNQ